MSSFYLEAFEAGGEVLETKFSHRSTRDMVGVRLLKFSFSPLANQSSWDVHVAG